MIINTSNENWKFDTEEGFFFTNTQNVEQIWISPSAFAELLGWYSKYQREVINEKVNSSTGTST